MFLLECHFAINEQSRVEEKQENLTLPDTQLRQLALSFSISSYYDERKLAALLD